MSTPTDYRPMWTSLGLNLEKHDMLLGVLGQAYQDLFVSRPNRPKAMGYFDFVMSEVHGLRIKELLDAKADGGIIVGSYCVFVPEELILAVGGVSVGLCAGAEFGATQAEKYVPRNTCALIKSAFGFLLEKVCPYLAAADVVVGENTCDGKKKAYESLKTLLPRLYILDMPQVKSGEGKALLAAEYKRFAEYLEEFSGKKITAESLRQGIEIVNNKRKALYRLDALRAAKPAPIAGLDALLIHQVAFYDDPIRFTASVNAVCDELEERIANKVGVAPTEAPRVIVSGCPMAVPNWKVPAIIEGAGAVIVGEESCVGQRGSRNLVGLNGDGMDEMMKSLVERYFKIDCAIFTPNPDRVGHAKELATNNNADGIIHYALQFCAPYQMEAMHNEKALADHRPTLLIDTDYSAEDAGQLRTRIEAFLERIKK